MYLYLSRKRETQYVSKRIRKQGYRRVEYFIYRIQSIEKKSTTSSGDFFFCFYLSIFFFFFHSIIRRQIVNASISKQTNKQKKIL